MSVLLYNKIFVWRELHFKTSLNFSSQTDDVPNDYLLEAPTKQQHEDAAPEFEVEDIGLCDVGVPTTDNLVSTPMAFYIFALCGNLG